MFNIATVVRRPFHPFRPAMSTYDWANDVVYRSVPSRPSAALVAPKTQSVNEPREDPPEAAWSSKSSVPLVPSVPLVEPRSRVQSHAHSCLQSVCGPPELARAISPDRLTEAMGAWEARKTRTGGAMRATGSAHQDTILINVRRGIEGVLTATSVHMFTLHTRPVRFDVRDAPYAGTCMLCHVVKRSCVAESSRRSRRPGRSPEDSHPLVCERCVYDATDGRGDSLLDDDPVATVPAVAPALRCLAVAAAAVPPPPLRRAITA